MFEQQAHRYPIFKWNFLEMSMEAKSLVISITDIKQQFENLTELPSMQAPI
jgi:hypothetical protein